MNWVVTTAFYSALKFMEHALFPGDYEHLNRENSIEHFESFNDYKRASNRLNVRDSPHTMLVNLVEERFIESNPDIVNAYTDLKSLCMTARYDNYKVEQAAKKLAKESLEAIKNCVVQI